MDEKKIKRIIKKHGNIDVDGYCLNVDYKLDEKYDVLGLYYTTSDNMVIVYVIDNKTEVGFFTQLSNEKIEEILKENGY